jgi:hypothetical protein
MVETTTWYALNKYSSSIQFEQIEVIRETESCLISMNRSGKEQRHFKTSGYAEYFPSKADALKSAISQADKDTETRRVKLTESIEKARQLREFYQKLEEHA